MDGQEQECFPFETKIEYEVIRYNTKIQQIVIMK